MTTYVEARDALVSHMNTNWPVLYPTVKVFYENTLSIDLDKVGAGFVKMSVDFLDAVQSDMDLGDEGHVVVGEVVLTLFYKAGTGVRETLQKKDALTLLFKKRTLGGVTTFVPRPGRKRDRDGWVSEELLVPFEFWSKF